jgi:DNA-binding transcriptional MerR regulator
MAYNPDKIIEKILADFQDLDYIRPEDIPDIGLYMDQVTTFMDDRLQKNARTEGEKILTKTMINNYTKQKLLPPPVKKKYSREHLLIMLFIYYYKGTLSLQDLRTLLQPLSDQCFHNPAGPDISDVYLEVFHTAEKHIASFSDEIRSLAESSAASFDGIQGENREFLQFFALISSLVLNTYINRRVIEQLIDDYDKHTQEKP